MSQLCESRGRTGDVSREKETARTKSLQRGRKETCRWHMNAYSIHNTRTHKCTCILSSFQSVLPQKAFPLVYWLSLPTFSTSIAVVDEKEKGTEDTAVTKACVCVYVRLYLCVCVCVFANLFFHLSHFIQHVPQFVPVIFHHDCNNFPCISAGSNYNIQVYKKVSC